MAKAFIAQDISAEQFRQGMDDLDPNSASPKQPEFVVDLDRQRRCGHAEVVFGSGKSLEALIGIFDELLKAGQDVLATRIEPEVARQLSHRYSQGRFHSTAKTYRVDAEGRDSSRAKVGSTLVVTAGTSDLPIAEEARETIDWMGVQCELIADIGVAGPHRLVERAHELQNRDAIVVVAGMEGALPSVVAGYVDCPLIAVPTSVGYGASLGGIAALLSMLNSCAANVAVVNIDAGFKAGYLAGMITKRVHLSA